MAPAFAAPVRTIARFARTFLLPNPKLAARQIRGVVVSAFVVVLPDHAHLLLLAAIAKVVGALVLGKQNEISG
jgi:hypothetical protein